MAKAKHRLEHLVFQTSGFIKNAPIVIAVSGGRDSMALLHAMVQVFSKEKLVLCHFHHGDGNNEKFRNEAQVLLQKKAMEYGLVYETQKSPVPLLSELECRNARNQFYLETAKKHNTSIVALAHHLDDWVETQLIKLIRGCSFESLNQNLELSKYKEIVKWRPWIRTEQKEILAYLKQFRISYVEDPSNKENSFLRNWIRNCWLESLESFRPGSRKSLAFSLIHSLEKNQSRSYFGSQNRFPWNYKDSSISRLFIESLAVKEKKQCFAYFFYRKKFTFVKRSQIEEIIKQLDNIKNEHIISFKTFDVIVNAERVLILQKNQF